MCGFIGFAGKVSQSLLSSAASFIDWRGNISGGYHSEHFAIIARRLPRSGNRFREQPIVTTSDAQLALNGEIYNAELLYNLAGCPGVLPDDPSDVEFVCAVLDAVEDPLAIISQFNGEFALVFRDRFGSIFLARDAAGSRPLYFSQNSKGYAFSSSAKAVSILCDGGLKFNEDDLHNHIRYGVTGSGSVFESVSALRPGLAMRIDSNSHKSEEIPLNSLPENGDLISAISLSMGVRSKEDKQCAIAYSGGLDSSLLAILKPDIDRYSLRDSGEDYVSLDTNWVSITKQLIEEHFFRLLPILDNPPGSLTGTAISVLASKAKQAGSEILISGDVADEIFRGYGYYNSSCHGHPLLVRRSSQFDTTLKLLGIKIASKPDAILATNLAADSPESWGLFDMKFRLSQQMLLQNLDAPCLINGIEPRSPFLDLIPYRQNFNLDIRKKADRFLPIFEKLESIHLFADDEKRGIYTKCSGLPLDRARIALKGIEFLGIDGDIIIEKLDLIRKMKQKTDTILAFDEVLSRLMIQLLWINEVLSTKIVSTPTSTSHTLMETN